MKRKQGKEREDREGTGRAKVGGESLMEGKEKKLEGGQDRFMDTGTGRSVGIGLSVLWYRVIVQRKNFEWLFKTATYKRLDPDEARPNTSRSRQIVSAHRVLFSSSPNPPNSDFKFRSSHQFLGHQFICFLLLH